MNGSAIGGLSVRHILTAGAGVLVTLGYVDEGQVVDLVENANALIGAAMFLGSIAWSVWQKKRQG